MIVLYVKQGNFPVSGDPPPVISAAQEHIRIYNRKQHVSSAKKENFRQHMAQFRNVTNAKLGPIRKIVGKVTVYHAVQENMFPSMARQTVWHVLPVPFRPTHLLLAA
jgi:hypothetical protein